MSRPIDELRRELEDAGYEPVGWVDDGVMAPLFYDDRRKMRNLGLLPDEYNRWIRGGVMDRWIYLHGFYDEEQDRPGPVKRCRP